MTSRATVGILVLARLAACALTASIPHSLLLSSYDRNMNQTLSPNVTSTRLFDPHLPSDPFFYETDDTDLIVKFSNFGGLLQESAAARVIQAAQLDCSAERPSARMPTTQRRYTEPNFHRADLVVQPKGIRWGEWKLVLAAIETFLLAWDSVDMEFNVLDASATPKSIGNGYLEKILGPSAVQ